MDENETTPTEEKAGNRHNRSDYKMLQDIHDHAVKLGAACGDSDKKGLSLSEKDRRISEAWRIRFAPKNAAGEYIEPWPWVRDIFEDDGFLIVAWGTDLLRYGFVLSADGEPVFTSEPQKVEVQYIPVVTPTPLKGMPGVRQSDNALKAISVTDDTLTVGNYLALWGGRDLEGTVTRRKNGDGSRGEYFTKATQFDSDYTATNTVIVDWEHGFQPDGIGPSADEPLGRVDWSTAKTDERGLFVQRVLNRRNAYVKMLEELIDAGLIGTSSEAIPDGVTKAKDGAIQVWPLRRDTLTVNPMEPRMLTENQIHSLKTLALHVPAIKSAYEQCGIDFPCGEAATVDAGASGADQQGKIKAAQARLKSKSTHLMEYRI